MYREHFHTKNVPWNKSAQKITAHFKMTGLREAMFTQMLQLKHPFTFFANPKKKHSVCMSIPQPNIAHSKTNATTTTMIV